jgi:Rhodopirellula transposase DDE domain
LSRMRGNVHVRFLRGAGCSNAPGLPGELVRAFKTGGREYAPAGEPEVVNVHDFPDKELGKAIPYGIYGLSAGTGWVSVGTDHDTSAFAVETLRTWWDIVGRARYPSADQLLICADGGGSNGSRVRPGRSSSPPSPPTPAWRHRRSPAPPAPASGTRSSTRCVVKQYSTARSPCTRPDGAGTWTASRRPGSNRRGCQHSLTLPCRQQRVPHL